MKIRRSTPIAAAVVSLAFLGAASAATAEEGAEVWLMGGVQALSENDTAFPDDFINIPAVAAVAYPLTSILAVEGEFTWMIPVEQSVNAGSGVSQDLKTPDILTYQGNLRATLPVGGGSWSPYLVAGAGGATFLSNTDANRAPALDESETAFAINFGTGLFYRLTPSWSLRADFREFVAFPADDAVGLSVGGDADEVWMGRGTIGLGYRF